MEWLLLIQVLLQDLICVTDDRLACSKRVVHDLGLVGNGAHTLLVVDVAIWTAAPVCLTLR